MGDRGEADGRVNSKEEPESRKEVDGEEGREAGASASDPGGEKAAAGPAGGEVQPKAAVQARKVQPKKDGGKRVPAPGTGVWVL